MPFVITPKDHTVAIAIKDSSTMDSVAYVRKERKKKNDA